MKRETKKKLPKRKPVDVVTKLEMRCTVKRNNVFQRNCQLGNEMVRKSDVDYNII